MLRIGIVAGESSGDQLGASLMAALLKRRPDIEFEGMTGPKMVAAGCTSIASIDELSVMGIAEVVRRYPALRALRARLLRYFIADPPDIFIGIDVPDFVLHIEQRLKRRGVRTVHYVCPQVWAWRQGRAATIARSVDLLLAIFPFETAFFERHGVPVKFVGHPLADDIDGSPGRAACRTALGIPAAATVVALLPGSRAQEIRRLGPCFFQAALECSRRRAELVFVASALDEAAAQALARHQRDCAAGLPLRIVHGATRTVLGASDVALAASGTVTMEALFLRTPLVVAYRLAPLSYHILKRLVRVPYIAMPNLLANERLVPEFVQGAANPVTLAEAVLTWIGDPARVAHYRARCAEIHTRLRRDAAMRSADAVLGVLGDNARASARGEG